MEVRELGLSPRATNCLYRAGIRTVEELKQKRTWELQSIRSFGAVCLREVQEALSRLEAAKLFTNADRIRGMSDEELAAFHANGGVTEACLRLEHEGYSATTEQKMELREKLYAIWMAWLRQPAAEG